MDTKTVRLREDVYERVKGRKGDEETFSEAIDRLIGGPSLAELGEVVDEERARQVRDVVEQADEVDTRSVSELLERLDDR